MVKLTPKNDIWLITSNKHSLQTKQIKCYVQVIHILHQDKYFVMDRDSSVGIATRYGLDGPGIEFLWWREFPHPSRPALGPTKLLIQWVPSRCRWQSGRGLGVDHPPPSSGEVKERVELRAIRLLSLSLSLSPSLSLRDVFQGKLYLYFILILSQCLQ